MVTLVLRPFTEAEWEAHSVRQDECAVCTNVGLPVLGWVEATKACKRCTPMYLCRPCMVHLADGSRVCLNCVEDDEMQYVTNTQPLRALRATLIAGWNRRGGRDVD